MYDPPPIGVRYHVVAMALPVSESVISKILLMLAEICPAATANAKSVFVPAVPWLHATAGDEESSCLTYVLVKTVVETSLKSLRFLNLATKVPTSLTAFGSA